VLEEPPYFGWRVSRSLRRRRASPDVVEQGEEVRADLPTQDAASAMPKCKLELWWLESETATLHALASEALSPLLFARLGVCGTLCLRASVPCRASTVFAVGGASAERAAWVSRLETHPVSVRCSSFPSVDSTVVSASSRVPVVRCRRLLRGTFGHRDRETVGVRVPMYFLFRESLWPCRRSSAVPRRAETTATSTCVMRDA